MHFTGEFDGLLSRSRLGSDPNSRSGRCEDGPCMGRPEDRRNDPGSSAETVGQLVRYLAGSSLMKRSGHDRVPLCGPILVRAPGGGIARVHHGRDCCSDLVLNEAVYGQGLVTSS